MSFALRSTAAALIALSSSLAHADLSTPLPDSAAVGSPFDIDIGRTSCRELGATWATPVAADTGSVRVTSAQPDDLYPGAAEIVAHCPHGEGPVNLLRVVVDKAGPGAPAVAWALKALGKAYDVVAIGRGFDYDTGSGWALYGHGTTRVQVRSVAAKGTFEILYMTEELYERSTKRSTDKRRSST